MKVTVEGRLNAFERVLTIRMIDRIRTVPHDSNGWLWWGHYFAAEF
jgi:hypothetical protein